MNIKTIFSLILGFAVIGVLFQNCGPQLRSTAADEYSNNRLEGDGLTFFAGQDYDPALVPYELTDQNDIDRVNNYSTWQGFKAIAFTEDGELYAANNSSQYIVDQAEWERVVLERCQLWSLNKACSLFASGDTIAQDAEHFLENFVRTIQVPADFDGNLLPGMLDYWKTFTAGRYPDFSNNAFKGYAIGPHGGGQTGWSNVDQNEASRRALEFCEAISDAPCTLYAEAMTVVFDLNNYQWDQQKVFYGPRAFSVDEIPFVTEAARESIRTQYDRTMASGGNFLLWMDRYGNVREIVMSANPVNNRERREALARCNAAVPDPPDPTWQKRTCFLYSENNQVVMTRQDLVDSF